MMDASMNEATERLRSRLDAPEPQTWRPDDEASGHPRLLIGELIAVQQGTTSWGPRQIAILRDAEGQLWNVWLLNRVLIDEFLRQQPRIGETLAIAYDGRVTRDDAPDYEKYRLVVDRPQAAVEWRDPATGEIAHAADAPPPPQPPQPTPPPQPGLPPAAQTPVYEQPTLDPPAAETDLCNECGFANGRHASGCSNDIPF